ncbi:hypothetical protein Gotur_002728 [Gossypium turneri]
MRIPPLCSGPTAITLPHPRLPNPCFPLFCYSVFCLRLQPSDSPTPPCTDTFFIALFPDFAFTRLVFQRFFQSLFCMFD